LEPLLFCPEAGLDAGDVGSSDGSESRKQAATEVVRCLLPASASIQSFPDRRYPNESDRILGERKNQGGDIFPHGNCVTIGCLPITDGGIKESVGKYVFGRE
jgi:hypothetical protein